MKKTGLIPAIMALAVVPAFAADHTDAPAATAEPTADIADLYAWMSEDAETLNLVMTVNPFAGGDAQFSTAVQYAFHVNSGEAVLMGMDETAIVCQFYAADAVECWAGEGDDLEYVTGDPSNTDGIESDSGALKVFAGLRDDPFFFEFVGFTQTTAAVVDAAPDLDFDANDCPTVSEELAGTLVESLQSGMGGAGPTDTFAGQNVLALVVQIDKDLVNANGDILGIWGSTHAAQ